MPGNLPIHAETLRGFVMHDLGELRLVRERKGQTTVPNLSDARKFTAARAGEFGVPQSLVEQVAQAAIRDWRATQRAKEASLDQPIADLYLKNKPTTGVIGVRVIVELTYPNGRPPGAKSSVPILVNAMPSETSESIIARAVTAWNNHELKLPNKSPLDGFAAGGRIVQVVEGGFPQAQL